MGIVAFTSGTPLVATPAGATSATPETVTFSYNGTNGQDGATQVWFVPAGVTSITISAFGAQGGGFLNFSGGSDHHGGLGGHARAQVNVTPGERLQVNVGGHGGTIGVFESPNEIVFCDGIPPGRGGFNGGADGGGGLCPAGGGGGASDVRRGAGTLNDRIVVGGGGGGGANGSCNITCQVGGGGGGLVGQPGTSAPGGAGGGGGSQTSGGEGGWTGGDGSFGHGGPGQTSSAPIHPSLGGGGGGGGWYGGGGGSANPPGAGGGRSGHIDPSATASFFETAVQAGDGKVMITYTAPGTPTCDGKAATLVGTNGSDNLFGTAGDDVIVGLGGNDSIQGLGGNDTICGGDGNDSLDGGAGNDRLFGGSGNDRLVGGQGTNALFGEAGSDQCFVTATSTAATCEQVLPQP